MVLIKYPVLLLERNEMKYEIVQNGKDDYSLKYKDKEIKFHSTLDIVSKLQEANKNARMKLLMDLSKQGITLKELTKETKEDGKTIYDNSNREELEKIYLQEEQSRIFQESLEKMLGTSLLDLINDIGLTETSEVEKFSTELGQVMVGQFPSNPKTQIEKL